MSGMKEANPEEVFNRLGGMVDVNKERLWPLFRGQKNTTTGGRAYFTRPGVILLAQPHFNEWAIDPFLLAFPDELGFREYTSDTPIEHGSGLIKTAGQLCYMSFGPNRTKNGEAQKYLDNIFKSGHGSVLEHAQFSLLLFGADRAFTHELVRHRTGVAFSQVSQRYVDGQVLRFVERPEYQNDTELHAWFEQRIDRAAREYDAIAAALTDRQTHGDVTLSGEKKTELRKKVNQAARSCLPNETEAAIVMSGNIRALRHVCEMRASGAADVPIREVTTRIFLIMQRIEPKLFNDYKLLELPDGTFCVSTEWRKV